MFSPKFNRKKAVEAFSLVEVVLALGICTFVLVAILGLFANGVLSTRESEEQIHAANLASMLVSLRATSPTNDITSLPSFAIPTSAMTNLFGQSVYANGTSTNYIGVDGQTTSSATNAAYLITCRAGTNFVTGTTVAQVYLMLSWPPQISPTNASAGRYELITQIPLR